MTFGVEEREEQETGREKEGNKYRGARWGLLIARCARSVGSRLLR